MKKSIKTVALALLVVGLTMTSCKKKTTETPVTADSDETSTFSQHSGDVTTSNNTADMSFDDAENAIAPSSLSGFRTSAYAGICGATVDTSQISIKKITINYNGNSCDNSRFRTGSISVQLVNGLHWKDMGAILAITYTNFKVTVLSNNKSTTLNGSHYITNVSGGIVAHIGLSPNPSTIVRKIRSNNMNITFDDNTVRTWSVNRTRTWTGAAGTVTGLAISADSANVETWGTNRAGHVFTTVINSPIVVSSTCGWFAPVSGKKTHTFNNRVSTVTFGTDANGNVVTTGCPNHYILNWTSLQGAAKSYVGTY
jgi:hypothetical protein